MNTIQTPEQEGSFSPFCPWCIELDELILFWYAKLIGLSKIFLDVCYLAAATKLLIKATVTCLTLRRLKRVEKMLFNQMID